MLRKPLFLLLLVASIALAQSFRFGVEGGLPLTNAFNTGGVYDFPASIGGVNAPFICSDCATGSSFYSSNTKRYAVGATAELDFPFHLAVKADVLYKRLGFGFDYIIAAPAGSTGGSTDTTATTANSWEIPLLAKYSVGKLGPLRPYVEGGIAFRTLQGVQQTTEQLCPSCDIPANQTQTTSPAELNHGFTQGFVAGAGLELRHLLAGVFGEIRYTHWTADAFSAQDGLLKSTRNQADLLVGVTF